MKFTVEQTLFVLLFIQKPLNDALRLFKSEIGSCTNAKQNGWRFNHRLNSNNFVKRKLRSDTLKLKDNHIEDDEKLLKTDKSTTKSQSAIARLLESAQKLRSEVEVIEASNFTESKIPSAFSDFVTTKITDFAAIQSANMFQNRTEMLKNFNNTMASLQIEKQSTDGDVLEFRNTSASASAFADGLQSFLTQLNSSLLSMDNIEVIEGEDSNNDEIYSIDEIDSTESIIFTCDLRTAGSQVPNIRVYNEKNFTFASLPAPLKLSWQKLAQAPDIDTLNKDAMKKVDNFFLRFFLDWAGKLLADGTVKGTSEADKKFISTAFKVQVLLHQDLEAIEDEIETGFDLEEIISSNVDTIIQRTSIFVAFLKAVYGPNGKRLIDPSVTTPELNFDDLKLVGDLNSFATFLDSVNPKNIEEDHEDDMAALSKFLESNKASLKPSETSNSANGPLEIDLAKDNADSIVDKLTKSLEFDMSNLMEEENGATTTAEVLINDYFDKDSLVSGMVVSRAGAAQFQRDVLRDCFVVNSVKMAQGAVIYEGQAFMGVNTEQFVEKIKNKYEASRFQDKLNYTIVINEKLINLGTSVEQMALDSMLGSALTVIVFPSSWNSSTQALVSDPLRNTFRQIIGSLSSTSSLIVASTCFGLFNDKSPFLETGELPSEFLPMVLASMSIQYLGIFVETVVAKLKGVELNSLVVPSANVLFNYGPRTLFLSMPKNRNDAFDIAAAGVSTTLLTSLVAIFTGLRLTFEASQGAIANFPTVPLSLIKTNELFSQLLANQFPDLGQALLQVMTAANNAIGGGDTLVHLHWLVIVGGMSFISSVLQLIPIDNSAGSKLTFATVGRDFQLAVSSILTVFKFVLFVFMVFNVGGIASSVALSKQRLVFDYLWISQLLSSEKELPLAVDNVSEVSDGRKSLFCVFLFLVVISFFPYMEFSHTFNGLIDGTLSSIKELFTSGGIISSISKN